MNLSEFYATPNDPYCYPGTTVLINRLGIRDADRLQAFEGEITRERAAETLPAGRFDPTHLRAIHRHLFQDVYAWAGALRTVRIAKGGSAFCYPENIAAELERLCDWLRSENGFDGLSTDVFVEKSAHFLAELNAVHPFRDGNGRTQLTFLSVVAARAGRGFDFGMLKPDRFMVAMIQSFGGDEADLQSCIADMITG